MYLRLFIIYSLTSLTSALEKTICEPKLDTLSCQTGLIIQIDDVMYGRTQSSVCNPYNTNIQNLNCRSTQKSILAVQKSCQYRTTCLIYADNSFLGEDPCPSVSKYLHVKYRCVATIIPSVNTPPTTPTTTLPTTASTTASTPTPLTTTQGANNLPPGILPLGVQSNHTSSQQCHEYLISGPRGIPDSQLSASSRLSLSNNAHRARLFLEIDKYPSGFTLEGGWTAASNDTQPWIQVKMNWLTIITGITTQGRHVNPSTGCCQEWVTRYKIQHSIDGLTWETVKDKSGQQKIFIGNTDTYTLVTHMFDCPFTARFIRVEVLQNHGHPSMRLELLGCPSNTDDVGKCPKGWKERPSSGTCYYISDQSDKKTWENAMLTCKRRQGDVVKIDSYQEKAWLRNELQALQQSQKTNVWWVGLNNRPRFDNNYYKWGDGTSLNANILRWNPGEPNNSGGKEHCAQYTLTTDTLNDKNCDIALPFICELQKYWTAPVNKPGLVTLRPTVPSTNAPSTLPNKVPVPIGVTAVTSGPNVFTTGCFNQTGCAGRAWNNYPSCAGCGYYLTCAPSGVFLRKCPPNLKYDANIDACSQTTSTCRGP
ncbi:uncharacterized protein LOC123560269 [Mercenaria mercenaria]|uniref:uncharacterized protein LOC123560269 n=1 Tax=Mercenaria mercenaria TaxID=6596 RepID=UPI00234F7D1E|nr:uncharacterized protein LOC123560269 [Mercenaria mercenaria]